MTSKKNINVECFRFNPDKDATPYFQKYEVPFVEDLSVFKRALRGEDKLAFDGLMNKAREHASSCTVTPLLEPMDAVFLSILVEQEKEIISLRDAQRIGKMEEIL